MALANIKTIRLTNGRVITIKPLGASKSTLEQQLHTSQEAVGGISTEMPIDPVDSLENETTVPHTSVEETNVDNGWTTEATRFILDQYYLHLANVGPLKQFRTKKDMWEYIAVNLQKKTEGKVTKSGVQCKGRLQTVLRRKKVSKKDNSTSGNVRVPVEFEKELAAIASIDDSLEPEILQSSTQIIINKKTNENCGKRKRPPTKTEILQQMHVERESNKDKRLGQKLKALEDMTNKLVDAVNSK